MRKQRVQTLSAQRLKQPGNLGVDIGRIRHRLSRETQEKQAELQGVTQDVVNVGGFLLMRLFGR